MTKLASIEDLRNVLNRSNDQDTNRLMNSALELVTPAISGYLLTGFGRQDEKDVDVFLPSPHEYHADGRLVLQLRNALLVTGSVVVRSASRPEDVTTADPVPDMSLSFDTYRGYITILPEEARARQNHWYQVEYFSGFETSTDSIGKYYKSVPEWLRQGALAAAVEVYHALRKFNDTEVDANQSHLPALATQALAPYRRLKRPVAVPL